VVAEPRAANLASNAGAPEGSVVVAASLSTVDGTVGRTRNICLLTGAAVLLLLAAAGWFAVRGGLRPLRRIEETATVIAGGVGRTDPPGGDLSRRVSAGAGTRTEIGRLSAALDGMLGQLEAAFAAQAASEARMRRFVGDVSHELRTPLFGIRGFAELYQMGGLPDRADVDRTMTRIEREADRLAHLVEDLLLLARLDEPAGAGALPLHLAPMDLRTLAADAREDLRALDPSRPVELTGPAPSPTARPALIAGPGAVYGMPLPAGELDGLGPPGRAPVLGDEARLRQAVANLVGNAIAHTPAGSPVRIGVGTVGGDAVLEVADRGPGLDPEQAARVFDRFYRVDSSRSRDTGGAGLGLSIAQSLASAHGGRVELTSTPGRGATFRVVVPATPD
jgi:two-component system OmpR family sensor kinase